MPNVKNRFNMIFLMVVTGYLITGRISQLKPNHDGEKQTGH